jgi:hypothetical protein
MCDRTPAPVDRDHHVYIVSAVLRASDDPAELRDSLPSMDGGERDVDPYERVADQLMTAGPFPSVKGFRVEQSEDGQDLGVIEHDGVVGADEQKRIVQITGELPCILEEVSTSADGTVSRVADGRILGGWLFGPKSDRS